MLNRAFWRAAAIRALRTVCQTAAGLIGAAVMISEVRWAEVLSASVLAGLMSLLTSAAAGLP